MVMSSSIGDAYYIGLDGLQFLDAQGDAIELLPSQLHAVPATVNEVNPGMHRSHHWVLLLI